MTRRTTKVSSRVKERLEELKTTLGLKNESQVVAYLLAMYDEHFPSTTVVQHRKYCDAALALSASDDA